MRDFDSFVIDESEEIEEILESYDSLEELLEAILDHIDSELDENSD